MQVRVLGVTCGLLACQVAFGQVRLSGEIGGFHRYIGRNVISTGPITLTSHTTIEVLGGSITFAHPISCGDDRDGDDGASGSYTSGSTPEAGDAGLNGYNLTIISAKLGIPGQPAYAGPINILGDVDLRGGDGGNGGNGADSRDLCEGEHPQSGADGGDGGSGGNLIIEGDWHINVAASLYTEGGSGGDGGSGGSIDNGLPGPHCVYAGDGGYAGNAGNGGSITIIHTKYAFAGSELSISSAVTLSSQGTEGGEGGNGGGTEDGPHAGEGGYGGRGGAASNGGKIDIHGRTVRIAPQGGTTSLRSNGGNGGHGASGGNSGCGTFRGDCGSGYVTVASGPGGPGGAAGVAGAGANILIKSLSDDNQTSLFLNASICTNGGEGGNSGSCGYAGAGSSNPYDPNSWQCYDGHSAWWAEEGGASGLVQVDAFTGTNVVFHCTVEAEGGNGGNGGSGGSPKDCCQNADGGSGGNGGCGGPGAPGGNVEISGITVDVSGSVLHLDGGSGGDGGHGGLCGGHGGSGGSIGTDGTFYVWGTRIGTETIVNDTQEEGNSGLDREDCE